MATEKKELKPFTQVSEVPSGEKRSALYNTVEHLDKTKHATLRKYTVKHAIHEKRNAFYIHFKQEPKHNLFQNLGFKFSDAHLTIDEIFRESDSTKSRGFMMAHSTVIYIHPETRQQIVLHVYYDRFGQVKDIQAKLVDKNGSALPYELNPILKSLIEENITPARQLLKELLQENENLFRDAKEKADKLEVKLASMHLKLNKSTAQSWINLAEEFISAIDLLNRYSDTNIDKRGQFIKNQLDQLKLFMAENDEPVKKPTSGKQKAPPQPSTQPVVELTASPQNKKNMLFDSAISLGQKCQQLKSNSALSHGVELTVKQFSIINEIQVKLVCISNFFDSLTKKQQGRLNSLCEEVASVEIPTQLFLAEFWRGNLENVVKLYPHVAQAMSWNFIVEILYKLCETIPKTEEEQRKLKAVFDFMYENSSCYRWTLNSQNRKLFVHHVPTDDLSIKFTKGSLLTYACCDRNPFAYELLLQHGANPNGISHVRDAMAIPELLTALLLDRDEPFPFVKLLLQHGADANCEITPDTGRKLPYFLDQQVSGTQAMQSVKKVERKQRVAVKPEQDLLESVDFGIPSVFVHACRFKLIRSLPLLLPHVSLTDLMLTLVKLTGEPPISQCYVTSSQVPGCFVAPSAEVCEQLYEQYHDENQSSPYYAIIFFTDEPDPLIDVIALLIASIKEKITLLKQKDPKAFDSLLDEFINQGTSLAQRNGVNQKMISHYESCVFLLSFEPIQTRETHEKIVVLYFNIGNFLRASSDQTMQIHAERYYSLALELALNSAFNDYLSSRPVFSSVLSLCSEHYPHILEPLTLEDIVEDDDEEEGASLSR